MEKRKYMSELEILFEQCKIICGVDSLMCVGNPETCLNKQMIEFRKKLSKST